MKKYLFFFENELIKVENSWLFSDFSQIPLVLVVNYNENQWEKSTKWTKSLNNQEFSTLMNSFSKKNKYCFMKSFLEVRSIPILSFPLLFSSSGRLELEWRIFKFIIPPLRQVLKYIHSYTKTLFFTLNSKIPKHSVFSLNPNNTKTTKHSVFCQKMCFDIFEYFGV